MADLRAVFSSAWADTNLAAGAARVGQSNATLPDTDALIDHLVALASGR